MTINQINNLEHSLAGASSTTGTFVLGVGCQKGGTSWLHSQLSKSDGFEPGFKKEYHVFDYVYKIHAALKFCAFNSVVDFDDVIAKTEDDSVAACKKRDSILAMFRNDTNTYFDYFKCLLDKSKSATVTGDITPYYAGLPVLAFKHIHEQLSTRGVSVKIIFIMRDPVERVWSFIRMRRREDELNSRNKCGDQTEEESILEWYRESGVELRTQYEKTIRNIETVFNEDEIFYVLYEDLFTNATKRRLEEFLGLKLNSYDISTRVNESPKVKPLLNTDLATRIATHYRDTYLFCDSKFYVREKWRGFKYLSL